MISTIRGWGIIFPNGLALEESLRRVQCRLSQDKWDANEVVLPVVIQRAINHTAGAWPLTCFPAVKGPPAQSGGQSRFLPYHCMSTGPASRKPVYRFLLPL